MEIKLYNQDNLILLKGQPDNSIDCIYCDILFNTGKIFDSFSDRLGTPQQAIDFYRPRFLEMKRVLKNTGVIYIHCDYNLSHYIKVLLDEIFGISNFRNEIVWYFNSAPRKKKDFGKRHNIIFRYSKTDNYYFNENSKHIRQPYSKTAPRGYEKEKYYNPLGKILDDVWKMNSIGQNDKTERVGYDTQKPKSLLYPIIDSSCPKDGVFADFFCGSGTTAIACINTNRHYIGFELDKHYYDIANERIQRTMQDKATSGKGGERMNNTMTFKIHYDGDYSDEIIISGESIEDIHQRAFAECEKRGWDTGKCWSERI